MIQVVNSISENCTGCNRCVRECPMETVNITYQDEDGNIKVKIDHDKCISCGRCVSACKHDARHFTEDIDMFLDDLSKGVPISLIVAPSVRTNIPEYKRLFTYLKRLGVNKIYDVSLGADICIWGYVRYLKNNPGARIITQPCPVVVTYCEMYHHDLLPRLSPVHSPMACASVYMKKYQGITDRIAALSPCIAKKVEFEATGLAEYNITFANITARLKSKGIALPDEETEFDHDESGLGSLFPMPGGLKENIEYFLGRKFHISKAEGFGLYEKLNQYAQTPERYLPEVYDVLNCEEGCNIGPAASHVMSLFEIDKTMDDNRKKATEERKREFYDSVYKKYDETFELSYFLREYVPKIIPAPVIDEYDIDRAFELLGKTDYEKRHVDCGSCGSDTCYKMARKIALGVSIKNNCIVYSMDTAMAYMKESEAQKHMLELGERLRMILNANPQINVLFDNSLNVIECNPAAIEFLGFESKEDTIAGFAERMSKSIPPFQSDGRESIPLNERLMATVKDGYVKFESDLILDGENRNIIVEFIKIPFEDSFAIVGYVFDMTEIHRRETALKHAQELNELQLAKLGLVVQASKIGLWDMEIVDGDTTNPDNHASWSDEFRHMLGYTGTFDFPNSVGALQEILHPEDLGRATQAFLNHLIDKTGKTPYDTEFRLRKKNGEYAYFHATGETIRDKDGNPVRVAGALIDITEAKNILLLKEQQRADADAASKSKSAFLANMSHEIRTPMNAIIGMTSIGKSSDDMNRIKDCLEKIDGASKHLLGLINDILDMSKIESGKFTLSESEFDFNRMINQIVNVNKFRIDEKSQNLSVNIDMDIPPYLFGDDQRLSQVITNLISNASKFTPDYGNIWLDARFVSEVNDVCTIRISVTDSGIGISPEQQAKLFQSFQQAESDTSRKFGGTGLGLAISRSIVEMMGGRIWIESELGKGAAFIFTVQVRQGSGKPAEEMVHDETIDRYEGHYILLAEDVEINREIVLTLLEPTLLTIDCAVNGREALEMFASAPEKYDLIFMDMQMPEMDGLEATRAIRALNVPNAKTIPIIAMTANAFREDVVKCLDAGMNGHLGKPLDFDDVLSKLRTYLLTGFYSGLVWDKKFELGNSVVDRQHKGLCEMVNNLILQCEQGKASDTLQETLAFLVDYTVYHFDSEETLQRENGYPDFDEHKTAHEDFKTTVADLVRRFNDNGSSEELVKDIRETVIGWLTDHMQNEDTKIGDFLRSKTD